MELMTQVLEEVVFMTVLAAVFSFVIWKLTKRKTAFRDFLTRYGDMCAYAGLLLIVLIIILVQGWN